MALVALTDEQKKAVGNTQRYKDLMEFAMLDNSTYWIGQDGSGLPVIDLPKWAKSRWYASNVILRNPTIAKGEEFQTLGLTFLDMAVYDNVVPFDPNIVIDFMVTAGSFDTLAGKIFDQKIKEVLF